MQPTIGILMLDTRFPRTHGDAGNPSTWPFPVRIAVVGGASPERVVRDDAEGLIDAFVDAGLQLVAQGVDAITTTCGFLVLHQRVLARRLPVPYASAVERVLKLPVYDWYSMLCWFAQGLRPRAFFSAC